MKILIVDNYDSFTYNLVHILQQFGGVELDIRRNDKISVEEAGTYDRILFSPGPGIPAEAGNMMDIIRRYAPEKPMLGVCLGHQAIAEAFGGSLTNLERVMHGVATETVLESPADPIFQGMNSRFMSGRYHSWVVNESTLPACLTVTARDTEGIIMALSHRQWNIKGVQFHPESILTDNGAHIIENWIHL
jgi:anthranilate synthase component II